MRTTLELPDSLFKHLKTKAAMEGVTLRDLVIGLVEKGLQAPTTANSSAFTCPSVSLGAPMAVEASELTNAKLASYLDE